MESPCFYEIFRKINLREALPPQPLPCFRVGAPCWPASMLGQCRNCGVAGHGGPSGKASQDVISSNRAGCFS